MHDVNRVDGGVVVVKGKGYFISFDFSHPDLRNTPYTGMLLRYFKEMKLDVMMHCLLV